MFSFGFLSTSMSSHQLDANKPKSLKCHHFCFKFDLHNYCPTCREAGKGDDPCVTQEGPCNVCSSLTEEQKFKLKSRKRYTRKPKLDSSKDKSDLLGDAESDDFFLGSHEELKSTGQQLYSSPPPQLFSFAKLENSSKHPQNYSSHTRYSISTKNRAKHRVTVKYSTSTTNGSLSGFHYADTPIC